MKNLLILASIFVGMHDNCLAMFRLPRLASQANTRVARSCLQKAYYHDVEKLNMGYLNLKTQLDPYKATSIYGKCPIRETLMTSVHTAICNRDLGSLDFFLQASYGVKVEQAWRLWSGDLINAYDQNLRTPLVLALTLRDVYCNYSHDPVIFLETKKMVDLLIAYGADVNICVYDCSVSKTPLRYFLENFHSRNPACIEIAQQIVASLRDAGATIHPLFEDKDLRRNPNILLLLSGSYANVCTE